MLGNNQIKPKTPPTACLRRSTTAVQPVGHRREYVPVCVPVRDVTRYSCVREPKSSLRRRAARLCCASSRREREVGGRAHARWQILAFFYVLGSRASPRDAGLQLSRRRGRRGFRRLWGLGMRYTLADSPVTRLSRAGLAELSVDGGQMDLAPCSAVVRPSVLLAALAKWQVSEVASEKGK